MRTFRQPGNVVELTAPAAGVVSGTPVQIGVLVVVPETTAAVGVRFNAATEGVFTMPKTAADAWAEGDLLYWNPVAGEVTNVAGALRPCGYAAEARIALTTTARVLLRNGGFAS
jgi:predicted RecA/RadA family phage recombinase